MIMEEWHTGFRFGPGASPVVVDASGSFNPDQPALVGSDSSAATRALNFSWTCTPVNASLVLGSCLDLMEANSTDTQPLLELSSTISLWETIDQVYTESTRRKCAICLDNGLLDFASGLLSAIPSRISRIRSILQ